MAMETTQMTDIYLGFDPGGAKSFGVALFDGDRLATSTVSTVDDAINWAIRKCGSRQPVAAGIDTLLHWATTRSGMRPCDLKLRASYPAVKNSVMTPNSLYGAMAIGGMALAMRLRNVWPKIVLNETHPKLILHTLRNERYNHKTVGAAIEWFVSQSSCSEEIIHGEHELDAAVSAWVTRDGLADGWPNIIGPEANLLFPAGPAKYLWRDAVGENA
jgi:predicted nuclease with RNAse H fold